MQKASSIVSFMLHPFMIPTYATILFLFGSSGFTFLPIEVRRLITMNIVVNTLLLPALLIFLSYRLGYLKDLAINDRRSRVLPIIIVTMCYCLAIYMLSDVMMIYVIRKFMLVALLALMAVFVINFRWKISLHLTAMGGFVAMITILNLSRIIYSPMLLGAVMILAGMLASSRLILGKHTLTQVAAGFLCGYLICVVTMLYL